MITLIQQYLTDDIEDPQTLSVNAAEVIHKTITDRLNELTHTHTVSATLKNLRKKYNETLNKGDGSYPPIDEVTYFGKNDAFSFSPQFGFEVNLFWEEPLSDEFINNYRFLIALMGKGYQSAIDRIFFILDGKEDNPLIKSQLTFSQFDIISATEYRIKLVEPDRY